ncbi:MAG: hypothetical protein ONB48_09140 [candidate division KSB1 bacterium]|nr:hypothetical protein [candidate division KSB1 bacterium]MDZ7275910.1 hypothetical protein [candidate division KSB1 bacterium]MDZ7285808.1 hypothetical protein [candidate division KSB1 bacterium]MDZ7298840.1 hypothetical protein [candidate division KSB1 bacterium]MDZ7349705.1 hypothetical protein [candidate division KSB1 bacterium]
MTNPVCGQVNQTQRKTRKVPGRIGQNGRMGELIAVLQLELVGQFTDGQSRVSIEAVLREGRAQRSFALPLYRIPQAAWHRLDYQIESSGICA